MTKTRICHATDLNRQFGEWEVCSTCHRGDEHLVILQPQADSGERGFLTLTVTKEAYDLLLDWRMGFLLREPFPEGLKPPGRKEPWKLPKQERRLRIMGPRIYTVELLRRFRTHDRFCGGTIEQGKFLLRLGRRHAQAMVHVDKETYTFIARLWQDKRVSTLLRWPWELKEATPAFVRALPAQEPVLAVV